MKGPHSLSSTAFRFTKKPWDAAFCSTVRHVWNSAGGRVIR